MLNYIAASLTTAAAHLPADEKDKPGGDGLGDGKQVDGGSSGFNPLEGLKPSYDVFGTEISQKMALGLAGVWGIAIVGIVIFVIWAWVKMSKAKDHGMDEEVAAGTKSIKKAGLAFLGCVATPLILAAGATFAG